LKDLALDVFTNRSEVAHIETSMVYEYLSNPVAPALARETAPSSTRDRG
jgi:hypothetical protein